MQNASTPAAVSSAGTVRGTPNGRTTMSATRNGHGPQNRSRLRYGCGDIPSGPEATRLPSRTIGVTPAGSVLSPSRCAGSLGCLLVPAAFYGFSSTDPAIFSWRSADVRSSLPFSDSKNLFNAISFSISHSCWSGQAPRSFASILHPTPRYGCPSFPFHHDREAEFLLDASRSA